LQKKGTVGWGVGEGFKQAGIQLVIVILKMQEVPS
jgi:hypothetical protein